MFRPEDVAEVYQAGPISGTLLKLTEPLSFWGGFDPQTGTIIDQSHPQAGMSIKGKVLALPYAKGSAGTPAAVAESIRNGSGPKALLIEQPDANLATGIRVAAHLYGLIIPTAQLRQAAYKRLVNDEELDLII